jgi:hypothetical protein
MKIAALGKKLIRTHWRGDIVQCGLGWLLPPNTLLHVMVKPSITYDGLDGIEITGYDALMTDRLRDKAKREGLDDVFMVFIDAGCKCCYGGYLSRLTERHIFCGIEFPHKRVTNAGLITFYSVTHMQALFKIPEEDVAELLRLRAANKVAKNQAALEFDVKKKRKRIKVKKLNQKVI